MSSIKASSKVSQTLTDATKKHLNIANQRDLKLNIKHNAPQSSKSTLVKAYKEDCSND
jgi:hypothetical protein